MSNAVSLVVDAVAIAAAIPSGGASLTLMEGLSIAGAAVNAIGSVTNNKTLQTIGAVAGLGAGVGEMASPQVFNSSISSLIDGAAPVADATVSAATEAATTLPGAAAPAVTTGAGDTAANAANQVTDFTAPPLTDPTALPATSTGMGEEAINSGDAVTEPAGTTAGTTAANTPGTGAQKGWLASVLGNNGDNTNAQLLKIGAAGIGGAMDYLAPSPATKSNIALQSAQTAALQQQQGILAARNTVATPTGVLTPKAAAPGSGWTNSSPAMGYGPQVSNGGAAMGYAPAVATPTSPQAGQGILAGAMPTQTNAQGLTLNAQGQIV